MRRLATASFVLALLAAAPAAEAQFTSNFTTTTNFTTSGSNERGIAYGVVGGNERIYVTRTVSVSNRALDGIYIYNANTGAFESGAGPAANGRLDATGITGGTVFLQDIEVTDDGLIYACNLATSSTGFKCYFWANENATPQAVTLTGIPAGAYRLGDRIRVTGQLASGINLWLASPGTPAPPAAQTLAAAMFRCTSTTATDFSCTTYDISGFVSNSPTNLSVAPMPGEPDKVWINGNGINARLVTLPAVPGAVTVINQIPQFRRLSPTFKESITNGTGNNSIYSFKNSAGDSTFVAMFEYSTGALYARGRIVNVTGIGDLASGDTTKVYPWGITPSASGVSASGLGDIAIRYNTPPPASHKGETSANAHRAAALPTFDVIVLGPNGGFNSSETSKASLPVELVAFQGVANGATARLSWTTASETNNLGFVVERQTGDDWTDVSALIAGHGTTTERHDYAFDVAGLATGRHTFRLRQLDADGAVHYSAPTTVEIGLETDYAVTLLGQRAVRVAVQEAQAVRVSVYDVLGRSVATLRTGVLEGTEELMLPSGLAAGSYLVRVEGERFATTKALVIR